MEAAYITHSTPHMPASYNWQLLLFYDEGTFYITIRYFRRKIIKSKDKR